MSVGSDRTPSRRTGGRRVRRVDDRLGLAVLRAGLSGRSLVTYARDHVTVRTPSRPTFTDGNTLDLLAAPDPAALDGWVDRFATTIAVTGARCTQLRWEEPPTGPHPALTTVLDGAGFSLTTPGVALLDDLQRRPFPAGVSVVDVAAPSVSGDAGAVTDRRWHAATVLYRYLAPCGGYHDFDAEDAAWRADVQRELAAAGRARVWVAMRHGAPVARCTVVHDRQGLAAVEDVVTHPVHRRSGVAAALVSHAVAEHLARQPASRVGIATPTSSMVRLAAALGFAPHAVVVTARRG